MTKYMRAVHDRTSPAPHDVLGRTSWRLSGGYVHMEPRWCAREQRPPWQIVASKLSQFPPVRDEEDEILKKNLVEKKSTFFNK